MYLFTRRRRTDSEHMREAMAFSVEICSTVNQITGLDVTAWMAVMGPDNGTIGWSTWVEHLADLEAAFDKLMANGDYMQKVEDAADWFEGPVEDGLGQPIVGQPPEGGPSAYVSIVRARLANGHFADGIALGTEVAEVASRITGSPTIFVLEATGAYGGVSWISGRESIQALEAAEAALMADATWPALVDRAGVAFQSDATQSIYRRMS